MLRSAAAFAYLLSLLLPVAADQKLLELPSIGYETAQQHEIVPHRRNISVEGIRAGFNQLSLTLTVSPSGDITHAEARGSDKVMKYWPQIEGGGLPVEVPTI